MALLRSSQSDPSVLDQTSAKATKPPALMPVARTIVLLVSVTAAALYRAAHGAVDSTSDHEAPSVLAQTSCNTAEL
jgi:hypothetical protein